MARPRKIPAGSELEQKIRQDIESGKKRGDICKEYGVSYQQLQKSFGFAWKKPRKEVTVTKEVAVES